MRWLTRKLAKGKEPEYFTAEIGYLDQRVQVLDVQAGDLLVIEYPNRMPKVVSDRLKAQVQAEYGVKLMILEGGMALKAVLHKDEVPDPPTVYISKENPHPFIPEGATVVNLDSARAEREDRHLGHVSKTERFNYPDAS
jgi:hypothetical protein